MLKKVYYVKQSGTKLRYGQKGGGLFSTLAGARMRRDTMIRQGGVAEIFEAEVEWTFVE